MKAWIVKEWCEPEQMALADISMPEPAAGQLRIRVQAAALNFFDILQIQGKYQFKPPFPFTPGSEVAGVVEAIGEGVNDFAIGDRVQAMTSLGGFAEYALAATPRTFRIPDGMNFAEGAAMPIVYQTSYLALTKRGALQAGEWLLVHSGAGGVGMAAIQIGKAMGAKIIATAGSDEKLQFCLEQGADQALSYRDESWVEQVKQITGGRGADVIYDPVGGDVFDLSTKCIAPEGRLLVIGFVSGRIPSLAANRVLLKSISVVGVFWGNYAERHPAYVAESQTEMLKMCEAGKLKPAVTKAYPFSDAPRALRDMAERKTYGKVVLAID